MGCRLSHFSGDHSLYLRASKKVWSRVLRCLSSLTSKLRLFVHNLSVLIYIICIFTVTLLQGFRLWLPSLGILRRYFRFCTCHMVRRFIRCVGASHEMFRFLYLGMTLGLERIKQLKEMLNFVVIIPKPSRSKNQCTAINASHTMFFTKTFWGSSMTESSAGRIGTWKTRWWLGYYSVEVLLVDLPLGLMVSFLLRR